MTYKLAIFDFDGTLADSLPWALEVINGVADRFAFKRIERAELDSLRGLDARRLITHLGVPMWRLPMIAAHLRALMAADIHRIPLFPGVERMLVTLADRGVALALVSSNGLDNVRAVLGPRAASLIAQYECGASMFGKHTKFRKVLARAGVAPAQAICIGDEIRDHEAAHRAGIPFGAVAWGYTRPEALQARNPARLFTTIDDILATLA